MADSTFNTLLSETTIDTNVKLYRINNMRIIHFQDAVMSIVKNLTLPSNDRPPVDYRTTFDITNSIGGDLRVSYLIIKTNGSILPRIAAAYGDGNTGGIAPADSYLINGTAIYFI